MRVTRSYRIDMGHRLLNHLGLCRNVHGHSYTFEVTVEGGYAVRGPEPDAGMVMDFADLDSAIREVAGDWDHALMLERGDPLIERLTSLDASLRLVVVMEPPTAENIAALLGERLAKARDWASQGRRVAAVRVYETPRSWAEWELPVGRRLA